MSIISLSFLAGDSFSRMYLTGFIFLGFNWQSLFLVTGFTMACFGVFGFIAMKNSPVDVGLPEPEGNPDNLLGESGMSADVKVEDNFRNTFLPIFISPSFWLLTLIYTLLTFMRYLLLDWIPAFLVAYVSASNDIASFGSVLPPLLGSVSTLMMGYLNDKLSKNLRNISLLAFEIVLVVLCGILFFLSLFKQNNDYFLFNKTMDTVIYFALFGSIGFVLNGPYSLPSSTLAIEYGGKKVNATLSGIFDGMGMIGATSSGIVGLLFLNEHKPLKGWNVIYLIQFICSILVLLATVLFTIISFFSSKKKLSPQEIQK
jgi:sugar phosphate permease